MKPSPWKQILKICDPNAVKQPLLDDTSDDSTDSSDISLPSLPPSLEEISSSAPTITISSDEDLESSMLELNTEQMVVSIKISD